jgi:hypothetical protein
MSSLRLIGLQTLPSLVDGVHASDFVIKVQSDDACIALSDAAGRTLQIQESGQDPISWSSAQDDIISSLMWFDVTNKLSILMVGFNSGCIRCFDKVLFIVKFFFSIPTPA